MSSVADVIAWVNKDRFSASELRKFSRDSHMALTKAKSINISEEIEEFEKMSYIDFKFKCTLRNMLCACRKPKIAYEGEFLENRIYKLHKFCLTHLIDSYRLHLNRMKGMCLLNEIVDNTSLRNVNASQVISLVWCTISFVHHFYCDLGSGINMKKLKSRKITFLKHIKLIVDENFNQTFKQYGGSTSSMPINFRKNADKALTSYHRLLKFLLPEHSRTVAQGILTFFNEANIWNWELLSRDLLKKWIEVAETYENIIHCILSLVEEKSPTEGRKILLSLHYTLKFFPWESITDQLLYRFLKLYKERINYQNDIDSIAKGLEICLRYIIENLTNDHLLKMMYTMLEWTYDEEFSDSSLLDFGSLLEYAAVNYVTETYVISKPFSIFPLLMELLASDNILKSLLANKLLHKLLDRKKNRVFFNTPRFLYQNTYFNIKVGKYSHADKGFLKHYREILHNALLASVLKHGNQRINLENSYTTIAILLVEVPCGFTAAAMVCLAMALQEITIKGEHFELESSHRIHATVISILSLICWIHNAKIFYQYVNKILTKRAEYAPYLNPPLLPHYLYAEHHILWHKPEFFFEDWETRYGLWTCFKERVQKTQPLLQKIKTKKLST